MTSGDSASSALMLRRAARAALKRIQMSQGWQKLVLDEGAFHTGDDPIEADQQAQQAFELAATIESERLGLHVHAVVGEEAIQPLPAKFEPGARVVVVDPLDGSTQWALFSSVFCVAAYCLVANETGALALESAVIANSQHCFTWRADLPSFLYGPIERDGEDDLLATSALPESALLSPSLAFTGFKTKDRKALLQLAEALPSWQIVTLGGNPVVPYIVGAGLTAALALRPQTTWDALAILLVSNTDVTIGDLEGTVLDPHAFRALFSRVVLDGNVRRVPALIVAKSQTRYNELVNAIAPIVDEYRALTGYHDVE